MDTLTNVQSLDDLLKIMAKQKAITNKAVRELHFEMDSSAASDVYKRQGRSHSFRGYESGDHEAYSRPIV